MTDKRPETSADILSRSRRVGGASLRQRSGRKSYSVDLPGHMAECDANYRRLLRLFPKLREQEELTFSLALSNQHSAVHFEVIERGPYTTVLEIDLGGRPAQGEEPISTAQETAGDSSKSEWLSRIAAPVLTVRIYHDAQSAEVISYQKQNRFHGKYDYPNNRMRQRDEKAQVNRFLSELLGLCLSHGVSNTPITFDD